MEPQNINQPVQTAHETGFKKSIIFLVPSYIAIVGYFVMVILPLPVMLVLLPFKYQNIPFFLIPFIALYGNPLSFSLFVSAISGLVIILTKKKRVYVVASLILGISIISALLFLAIKT